MRFVLVLLAGLLCGCPPTDTCVPNTSRCSTTANAAEVCSADGEWLVVLDCGDVGAPGWACCRTGAGCTCLPEGDEECVR